MSCSNCDHLSVEDIIKKWNYDREYVIEMMQDLQEEFRHISREALDEINKSTKVPLANLYHIATFYKAFSLEPKGKYEIQVCMGTACHVKGAQRVLEAFERELNIKDGETTSDQNFSLEGVRCLGCCSLAPVITISDELFGEVEPSQVPKLLKKYKQEVSHE
ncbi:NAD(P)H-dependent oxidoreductase subunit E [candidate division KSB1 bacterium]